jgi:hypothetical protein
VKPEPSRESSSIVPAVILDGEQRDGPGSLRPVSSVRHTVVLLGILALVALSGVAGASRGTARPAVTHLAQYTTLLVMEWLLFAFVLRGLRAAGTPLADVMGRRWSSGTELWKPVLAQRAGPGRWLRGLAAPRWDDRSGQTACGLGGGNRRRGRHRVLLRSSVART